MAETSSGHWSAFEAAVIVGRQNGKNAILEARELAGVVLFGDELIVHTAHRADTTMEHFRRMEQYADEFDEFRRLVKRVSRKNGDESIELKDHRRIKFVCRARNPGRGFSGTCIVFDEALKSLDPAVIGSMIPTLATRRMAQVWYTSSAPTSQSHFLQGVCARGRGERDADEPRLFYAEWGNDASADPDDMDAIARANPGLGIRITEQFVEDERRLMQDNPEEFARERLGIPEPPFGLGRLGVVDMNEWRGLAQVSTIDSHRQWALAVSPDRKWASLGVAGRRSDGLLHVEWMEHRAGTSWIVDRCVEAWSSRRIPIRVHAQGPEAAFVADLRAKGVEVDEVSTADYARATGQMLDAIAGRTLRHLGQPSLDKAVEHAGLKTTSAGAATWIETGPTEISTLKAVTVALGGVATPERGKPTVHMFTKEVVE
ncbi:MAG: hypothetical protein ABIO83_05725 [Ilumatobacteraceae bacterium]